jgi:hypothetical protein
MRCLTRIDVEMAPQHYTCCIRAKETLASCVLCSPWRPEGLRAPAAPATASLSFSLCKEQVCSVQGLPAHGLHDACAAAWLLCVLVDRLTGVLNKYKLSFLQPGGIESRLTRREYSTTSHHADFQEEPPRGVQVPLQG